MDNETEKFLYTEFQPRPIKSTAKSTPLETNIEEEAKINKYGKVLLEVEPKPFPKWTLIIVIPFLVMCYITCIAMIALLFIESRNNNAPNSLFFVLVGVPFTIWLTRKIISRLREKLPSPYFTIYDTGIGGECFVYQNGHSFIPWSNIENVSIYIWRYKMTTLEYLIFQPISETGLWNNVPKLTRLNHFVNEIFNSPISICVTHKLDINIDDLLEECKEALRNYRKKK